MKERLIGRRAPVSRDQELRRELRKMIRQIHATRVETLGDVRALGAALKRRWSDDRIRDLLRRIGKSTEAISSGPWRRFDRTRKDARGRMDAAEYDGEALVEAWSKAAAKLITSVRDEVAEGMRKDVVAALAAGTDPAELAAKWRREGIPVLRGTLEGRTKVIAQDQIATLHAQVQSDRARALGVTEFVWRTQGDDRVRDTHRALEGSRHRYDDPPSEGLPGTPINCRCWAESVIPDSLLFGTEGRIEP